ncbi:serine protease [Streptomyces sulfonofaciens]|uniref:Serine protease n=1 Tax=Streptomyces sulfonofaciens TaxID=68272 RepID=A0A919GML9_9ACTN|nr:serine protease [Streptomyces sulfonofaciens]GHH87620.1 serine protease [Streptomyces sulfonofaciens]
MFSKRWALALIPAAAAAFGLAGAPPAGAIIGGAPAGGAYPFMASLQRPESPRPDGHVCGASLIAERWAVTAAHCTRGELKDWKLRIGSSDTTRGGELIRVKRFVTRPDGERGHDIALLELSRPAHEAPVAVADTSPSGGTPLRILGWGQTCAAQDASCWPEDLRQLDTALLPDPSCDDSGIVPRTELCVGNVDGRYGAGNFDSGGPAVVRQHGVWKLVGATSGSNGEPGAAPTVYTDVTAFRQWIETETAHSR